MNHQQAAKVLKQFNDWRTDLHVPSKYQMPEPSEITKALNLAVTHLSQSKDQLAQGKITKRQEQLLHLFAELIDKLKSQLDGFALGVLDRNSEKFKILVPFWFFNGSKLEGEMTNLSVEGIKVEINYRDEIVLFTPLAVYVHEYSVIIKVTANKNTDNPAFQEIIDKFFEFHFPDLPEKPKS